MQLQPFFQWYYCHICLQWYWCFIRLQITNIGDRTNLVSNNWTIRPQRRQVLQLAIFSFRIMKWYFFPQTGCLLQPIRVEQINDINLVPSCNSTAMVVPLSICQQMWLLFKFTSKHITSSRSIYNELSANWVRLLGIGCSVFQPLFLSFLLFLSLFVSLSFFSLSLSFLFLLFFFFSFSFFSVGLFFHEESIHLVISSQYSKGLICHNQVHGDLRKWILLY